MCLLQWNSLRPILGGIGNRLLMPARKGCLPLRKVDSWIWSKERERRGPRITHHQKSNPLIEVTGGVIDMYSVACTGVAG